MSPSLVTLIDLLRRRVSEQDIRDFAPGDPGYPGYVRTWTDILTSGSISQRCHFNLSEVINLCPKSTSCTEPDRFWAYRLLTSSVAFHLYLTGNDCESVRPTNYVAIRLIDDAHDLDDGDISILVGDVLTETAVELKAQPWIEEEYPFLYAAEMIWAQRFSNFERSDIAAKTLLSEEHQVRSRSDFPGGDSRFLFGLTNYGQLNADWNRAFAELVNPNRCEETQLVIDATAELNEHCT